MQTRTAQLASVAIVKEDTTLAPAAAVHRGSTYGAVTIWRNPMAGP